MKARTGSGMDCDAPVGRVRLTIRNSVLRLALQHVAVAAGYEPIVNAAAGGLNVTDSLPPPGSKVHVLVAPVTPVDGRIAARAVMTGLASAVIADDDPEQLPAAIEGVNRGIASLPSAVLAASGSLPSLTRRQHELLACMAAGGIRDSVLAQTLRVSVATVKRELRDLFDFLTISGRHELAELARDLGYRRLFSMQAFALMTVSLDCRDADGGSNAVIGIE